MLLIAKAQHLVVFDFDQLVQLLAGKGIAVRAAVGILFKKIDGCMHAASFNESPALLILLPVYMVHAHQPADVHIAMHRSIRPDAHGAIYHIAIAAG